MVREQPEYQTGVLLGSVKKVYGGAFCGHADAYRDGEQDIIQCFVDGATSLELYRGKDISKYEQSLWIQTRSVVERIRDVFDFEVDSYLKHFAQVLVDSNVTLRWNLEKNNCQQFAVRLLKGLDLHTLFYRIPRNYFTDAMVKDKKSWPSRRYLLSFGSGVDTPLALLRPQHRSLVWRFYHDKRDHCDMIEYAEELFEKPHPASSVALKVICNYTVPQSENPAVSNDELSTVDALWTLPRDTLSILQTHLMRSRARYSSREGYALTDKEWTLNRLRVLDQLSLFAATSSAFVCALIEEVAKTNLSYTRYLWPIGEMHGTLYVSERVVEYRNIIMFVTGRERDWHKRELLCLVERVMTKIERRKHKVSFAN